MEKGDLNKLVIAVSISVGLGVALSGGIYQFKSGGKDRGGYVLNKFTGSVQHCFNQHGRINCVK